MLASLKWILGRTGADDCQWSWAFDNWPEVNNPPFTFLDDLTLAMQGAWASAITEARFPAGLTLKRAEVFAASGGPAVAVHQVTPAFALGTGGTFGPEELAVCVTDLVDSVRGPAAKGRCYFGPFAGTETDDRRPAQALCDELLAFQVGVHAVAAASPFNLNPVVISRYLNGAKRGTPVGLNIVQYAVDDAWDSQRRRGYDEGTRTFSGII